MSVVLDVVANVGAVEGAAVAALARDVVVLLDGGYDKSGCALI